MTISISDLIYRFHFIWRQLVTQTWLRLLFKKIGKRTTIYPPVMLKGAQYIEVGSGSLIRNGCRIETVDHAGAWKPHITIGNNVNIEQNVHIICQDRIIIEDEVSITANCSIVDTTHPSDVIFNGGKIGGAILVEHSPVVIGRGTFVGIGSTILPGSTIGENCVIGAGSVVTGVIPPYSVAVGSPARVLRTITAPKDEA